MGPGVFLWRLGLQSNLVTRYFQWDDLLNLSQIDIEAVMQGVGKVASTRKWQVIGFM